MKNIRALHKDRLKASDAFPSKPSSIEEHPSIIRDVYYEVVGKYYWRIGSYYYAADTIKSWTSEQFGCKSRAKSYYADLIRIKNGSKETFGIWSIDAKIVSLSLIAVVNGTDRYRIG